MPSSLRSFAPPRRTSSWLLALAAVLALITPALAAGQGVPGGRAPLGTSRKAIAAFRDRYASAFNRKDAAAVAGMYAPDAVLLSGDGRVLAGQDTIRKVFTAEAANWPELTIKSDTLRVIGRTAWDVGTVRFAGAGRGEQVSHYLTVLRRGAQGWRLSAVAVVPETPGTAGADAMSGEAGAAGRADTPTGADSAMGADSAAPR